MNRSGKLALVLSSFAVCATAAIVHRGMEIRRTAPKPADLYEVVWRQIRAFRKADYSQAYQQVSATFQEHFNIEEFADIARTDYPDLTRVERVEFGSLNFVAAHAIIQVYFILPEGEVVPCLYSLVHEEDVWKIETVRVLKRWPATRRLGGMRS